MVFKDVVVCVEEETAHVRDEEEEESEAASPWGGMVSVGPFFSRWALSLRKYPITPPANKGLMLFLVLLFVGASLCCSLLGVCVGEGVMVAKIRTHHHRPICFRLGRVSTENGIESLWKRV